MRFSISLTQESVPGLQARENAQYGVIVLNDYSERLIVPTNYWSPDSYERHWREAVRRVLEGDERSALITSMYDPHSTEFIRWWPMYLHGGSVRFQNQILFLTDEAPDFKESEPFKSVPPHNTRSEDDTPISEWLVTVAALRQWYERPHA